MSPALSGRQGPKRNAESGKAKIGKLEGRWCDRVRPGTTGGGKSKAEMAKAEIRVATLNSMADRPLSSADEDADATARTKNPPFGPD
jgi:hypothetical protein